MRTSNILNIIKTVHFSHEVLYSIVGINAVERNYDVQIRGMSSKTN